MSSNESQSSFTHSPRLPSQLLPALQSPPCYQLKMSSAVKNTLTFEAAQPLLQEAVNRVIGVIEGAEGQVHPLTPEEYVRFYTVCYEVCIPNPFGPDAEKLYHYYKQIFQDYVSSKYLPSLRGKRDEELLQELLKTWGMHKKMTHWLSRFFYYLERYYTKTRCLPDLEETSHLSFYELVYGEINDHVRDAVLSLIDKEREGEQIDQTMVREVLEIYVEIGAGSDKYYKSDFEEAMMKASCAFYARKFQDWIRKSMSVEECSNLEKTRIQDYLKFRSKEKVLEIIQKEMVRALASKLEEKIEPNQTKHTQ